MDAADSTAPLDIGTTLAVIGVSGWRCCICNTTFPRSFSVEHHMITSHHPLPQQQAVSSLGASTVSPGHRDLRLAQEQNDSVQDTAAGASFKETVSLERSEADMDLTVVPPTAAEGAHRGRSASQDITDTSRNTVSPVTAEGSSSRIIASPVTAEYSSSRIIVSPVMAGDSSSLCDRHVAVKEEPNDDSLAASLPQSTARYKTGGVPLAGESSVDEEGLPVYFSTNLEQQRFDQPAETESQDAVSHSVSASPQVRMQCHRSACSSTEDNTNCILPQHMRRRVAMKLDSVPLKPSKRRICSCGQVFEKKQDFRYHRRVVHCRLSQKIFICHICNAQYGYKRGLNRHLAIKGQVAFVCSDCPERFHDQVSLDAHKASCHSTQESRSHDDNSPHPGEEQMRGIEDQRDQAAVHSESDSDGRDQVKDPWECSKCRKHFVKKYAFRIHLHECGILKFQDGQQTFHCNLCSAKFQWLVRFHRHYVHDHKLASLARGDIVPFMENSPAPSPCPSVTSEINSAMAGVDLNQFSSLNLSVSGSASPAASLLDLTTEHGSNLEQVHNDSGSGTSSNPQSLTSDTGSSEQAREANVIVLSDIDDSKSGESWSDDGDDEWEMLSDVAGERSGDGRDKNGWGPKAPGLHSPHRSRGFHRGMLLPPCYRLPPPPPPPPPPSGHPFLPPPPPPPPPLEGDFHSTPLGAHHFPHRHHHHQDHHRCHHGNRCGRGRFPHDRGAYGPWSFCAAAGFSHRGWNWEQDSDNDEGTSNKEQATRPETAAEAATCSAAGDSSQTGPSPPGSAAQDQDAKHSAPDEASPQTSEEGKNSEPLHKTSPCVWAENMRETKYARKMMKKAFWSIFASCRQGKTFFFCPDCLQAFSEETELDAHSRENHSAPAEYLCFFCHQPFSDPLAYNKHIRQHCEMFSQMPGRGHGHWMRGWGGGMRQFFKMFAKHSGFGPDAGPFWFRGPRFGPAHHSQGSDKDYSDGGDPIVEEFKECPYCLKKFRANSRENYFERHVNSHLGVDTFNFKCEVANCGKTFLERAKYLAHMATHTTQQVFVCTECGKSYQNKTSLTRHQRIHTGERPYK